MFVALSALVRDNIFLQVYGDRIPTIFTTLNITNCKIKLTNHRAIRQLLCERPAFFLRLQSARLEEQTDRTDYVPSATNCMEKRRMSLQKFAKKTQRGRVRYCKLKYCIEIDAENVSHSEYRRICRLAVDMDIHGYIHGYYAGAPAN